MRSQNMRSKPYKTCFCRGSDLDGDTEAIICRLHSQPDLAGREAAYLIKSGELNVIKSNIIPAEINRGAHSSI